MTYVPIFTFNGGMNPNPDYARILVHDVQEFNPDGTRAYIFSDQEINAVIQIAASPFQSLQFYSPQAGQFLPQGVGLPWYLIAAILCDSMSANASKLALVRRILDVEMNVDAAKWLQSQAKAFREQNDNTGGIFIIEQCVNEWTLIQRYNSQIQRQQGVPF